MSELSPKILQAVAVGMTKQPRAARPIIKAANALVQSVELYGLDGVSITHVSRLAKVSRTSIYRVFPSVWDLVAFVGRIITIQWKSDGGELSTAQTTLLLAAAAHKARDDDDFELTTEAAFFDGLFLDK